MVEELRIVGLSGLPEFRPGDDLVSAIFYSLKSQGLVLQAGDILVITQKVVSKVENRIVVLTDVIPSARAEELARTTNKDPRMVELVLRESVRVVRKAPGVLITETRHGFICANAGIDSSNIPGEGVVSLLPLDPDRSACALHLAVKERCGLDIPVIISDTFGRPWREGQTNVAIGVAGMLPFIDYAGQQDPYGHELKVSALAVADELASAVELVMGKLQGVPVALVRGFDYPRGNGSARDIIRPPERDLFR
ncbi:MAG TPA: coenzyme F420-0:L-glutamate ligase [Dehalococcoidia bacterium]|nr:coenzyme F420-0:L-glutamate ligase [Dehalococcoidia bacterium]